MANEQNLIPAKKGEIRNPKSRGGRDYIIESSQSIYIINY